MSVMNAYFSELHGQAMDAKDGSIFHDVTVRNHWGVASGVNAKGGAFLRVFELDEQDFADVKKNSRQLGQPGQLDVLTAKSPLCHDVALPKGVSADRVLPGLMDKLNGRSIYNTAEIEANTVETLLTLHGISDNAANHIAMRKSLGAVTKALEDGFEGQGPDAFADKPSKNLIAVELLKRDLGAEGVTDFSFRSEKPALKAGSGQHATVLREFAKRPGF